MIQNTYKISAPDGCSLFGRQWMPEGPVKAAICLVHGFGEHSGRYPHVAEAFVREGWAVTAPDLRGHGNSEGPRGYIPSYNTLIRDLSLFLDRARETASGRPVILYGHSAGGNLVLNYVLRKPEGISGLVASSPWLRLVHPPGFFLEMFALLMTRLWPLYSRETGDDPKILTRDPVKLEEVKNDPLVHNRISARFYRGMRMAGLNVLRRAGRISVPRLIMHGSGDRLMSPAGAEEFASRMGPNGTFKMWDGYYHELHNDIGREDVIGYIVGWIDRLITT